MTARTSLAAVLLGFVVAAAGPPGAAAPGRGQDVLFLAPGRPLLLRLHVEVDGRAPGDACRAATDRYARALFRHLDRDGDGALNEAEAAGVPAPLLAVPGAGS